MEKLEFKTNSFTLKGHKWEIDNPKVIIVIFTGMAEHSGRYNHFASYLNSNGFSVFCLDHDGQGENGELGNPSYDFWLKEVDFMHEFIISLKEKGLPIYLFSHSMGSFLAQNYIEHYSNSIEKVVLCGTGYCGAKVKIGKVFASMLVTKRNLNKKATIVHNLSVGAYEKKVKKGESVNSWISFNEENVKKYDEDELCGVRCTNKFYISFIRGMAKTNKRKNLKTISKKLPILITGGESDAVSNNSKDLMKLYKRYSKFGLNVNLKIYKNMKHEILNEKNNMEVYEDLLNFFIN